MLVAERGGIRNLGLAAEAAFAVPNESRSIRYELDQSGAWRPVGRYDVGFYDRQKSGPPFIRANCAGGVSFGPGYTAEGQVSTVQADQFVWNSGDALCSPEGPCNLPGAARVAQPPARPGAQPVALPVEGDDSQVHGIQGMRESAISELAPGTAYQSQGVPPAQAAPRGSAGPNEAYLIDVDVNVEANGAPEAEELLRNDATAVGDVVVYQNCDDAPAAQAFALLPARPLTAPPPVYVWGGHPLDISHAQYASHGVQMSHFRWGSHYADMSHAKWGSHSAYWSHDWILSGWHSKYWSHWPKLSHAKWGSIIHLPAISKPHYKVLSGQPHNKILSAQPHNKIISVKPHSKALSTISPHTKVLSGIPPHNKVLSVQPHTKAMSTITPHNKVLSGVKPHNKVLSGIQPHSKVLSTQPHSKPLSTISPHTKIISAGGTPHNKIISTGGSGGITPHNKVISAGPVHKLPLSPGVHSKIISVGPAHKLPLSPGVHKLPLSPGPVHNAIASAGPGVHKLPLSPGPVHRQSVSKAAGGGITTPTHSATLSQKLNQPPKTIRQPTIIQQPNVIQQQKRTTIQRGQQNKPEDQDQQQQFRRPGFDPNLRRNP
jgi:hypothetical protein